jgi:hypothetical protein
MSGWGGATARATPLADSERAMDLSISGFVAVVTCASAASSLQQPFYLIASKRASVLLETKGTHLYGDGDIDLARRPRRPV